MGSKSPLISCTLFTLLILPLIVPTWVGTAGALPSPAGIDWKAYERGDLGVNPQARYYSISSITAPLIHVTKSSGDCETSSYTFFSPWGDGVPGNKALIVDQEGELIWSGKELGAIVGFQVQKYKGNDYLTYWVGDDHSFGHGHGYYKMLDQTYTLAYTISAANEIDGDFHEFSITRDDTALLTAYVKTAWDLSKAGINDTGYIWDCVFQEINIETGKLLFEWRASQHFTLDDMAVNSWQEWVGTERNPWDWFHLNSVEKDYLGNYLIAARYTNAVTYIDGRTGKILWHLGGNSNSFADHSRGMATSFTDPHMARWTASSSAITLFDNIATSTLDEPASERQSHAMIIRINQKQKTAEVITDFVHPEHVLAVSGGSIHPLKNGNYFIGWGSVSAYSEFSNNGTLLCGAHYSPLYTNDKQSTPGSGYLENNRIYKQEWTGYPKAIPNVHFADTSVYVSWNGATEVQSWKLEGRGSHRSDATHWSRIGIFNRDGFETHIDLGDTASTYSSYLLTALDSTSASLGIWIVNPEGDMRELVRDNPRQSSSPSSTSLIVLFICISLLLVLNRRHLANFQRLKEQLPDIALLTAKLQKSRDYAYITDSSHRLSPVPSRKDPFSLWAPPNGQKTSLGVQ